MDVICSIRKLYFKKKLNKDIETYFILNNSSCDMDSFLCSILLSIVKNINEKVLIITDNKMFEINEECNFKKIYLPLMNCKRGELKTRLDIGYTMDKFKINEESLFYVNDEEVVNNISNSKIILVDHNTLDENKLDLSNQVEEIYDHHYDNSNFKNLVSKNIKFPLGSCSTLVILDYFISNKLMRDIIDPLLMVTAILQDTNNFNKDYYRNRWVDLDFFVYQLITQNMSETELTEYYKNLCNSKYDENANLNLGIDNLMTKDRKLFKWANYSAKWSSLQIALKLVTKKYGWLQVNKFFEKEKCNPEEHIDFYITLSSYSKKDNIGKVAIIYDFDNIITNNLENFKNYLQGSLGNKLKNIKIKKQCKNVIKIFLDETLSRKTLEPVIKNYFKY